VHEPTLILNRNWSPISTTHVRQALVLLCRQSAAAVCPETYELCGLERWVARTLERLTGLDRARLVRTPTSWIEKPEVIILCDYAGVPRREVAFSRRNLYRRDDYRCQYCKRSGQPHELSIDHVVPRSRGGKTTWENCVLACVRCNSRKANKTPRESGLLLERPPSRPTWSPLVAALPRTQPDSWKKFLKSA
jgi:5-methylcytosine-specific restriction endonuclease McrA